MITLETLTHVYPARRHQAARTAIHDLSLTIPDGTFCILSGPNGSGKSTLFRILCGLMLPTAGRVQIGGHDALQHPDAVRRMTGVVFQSPAVDKHLSVIENLRLHGALYGLKGAAFEHRLTAAIGWSDIASRLNDRVDSLSGGLARQVELAKVLLTEPRLLLLDEPTTGLDPASRRSFLVALRHLQRDRGMTVLMTSHVFSEAEDADSVAIMRDGHLLVHDSPRALKALVGREMVVVETATPTRLAAALLAELGLPALVHGDEVRIDAIPASGPDSGPNSGAVALIDTILQRWQPEITSIAVKQPSLEDVFIHVTGKTAVAEDSRR
ncbi:ABC transporter ATP-binding protein [Insolitispirillum peregrinum]|uniref:ABC-2 type transport system ATP-binding protein n=1 Tax=Insolitispirillum peregrinum TaxID=80876 RepID=A0A1N7IMR7_9PROT|nr:ABC transporter ATP-binding protein [Insolitispirillum peregrinum]SIS38369.1 ABC-2 type transport system ATP-binding protein [Insolitispirillum peregrinum]